MQLFLCCTLLLLVSNRCSCGFRLKSEKLSLSCNRNALECLKNLISVTNWSVHDFLVISDDMDIVDDDFMQRYSKFRWKIYSKGKNNLTGFSNIILFAKSFYNLNETLRAMNIRRMDSRAKFVVSVAKNFANLDEIKKTSKGIPEEMWKLDKTYVIYLIPCEEEIFAMTYFPFAINCRVGELEVLDIWRGKHFVNGAELFPEKMLDIHGCIQNHTAAFSNGSVLQLQKEFTKTGEITLGGVAGKLMTIVAEKMNMNLHTVSQPHEFWPQLVNQIARGESLFALSGTIPLAGQSEFLDLDSGFMEESFGLGYVVGGFEVSWKNLVWPLSMEVWQCTVCTGLLFCGLLFVVNLCHSREITYEKFRLFDSFGIFLGTARILPRSYFGRYLIGMWIVYSYLINASYNSGLVSFLTTPNEKRVINTLEELLADGIDFGGGAFHRELYHDTSDPVMMKIYNNFKVWPEHESGSCLMNRQCVTGLLNSFVYMYNSNNSRNVGHQLRMLEEKALTYQVPIPMRRGSPFIFGVRRYTSRAIEGGFHKYWLKYYTRKSRPGKMGADTPTAVSLEHLKGILYIHIAGSILSCVVFCGELIFCKYFRK